MLERLSQGSYPKITTFFDDNDYSLALQALLAGTAPGVIYVDDPGEPRLALALTVEGYFLGGDHDKPASLHALDAFLEQKIFTADIFQSTGDSFSLGVSPESWADLLPELIPTHEVETLECYHYLCRQAKYDWRTHLPAGYTMRRMDHDVLLSGEFDIPDELPGIAAIELNWGSVEHFLAHGCGTVMTRGDQVVSWSAADCAVDERIEIGIHTHPQHRRRGLGAATAAVNVEGCLERGFTEIGWHCLTNNTGSWKIAEKVGFLRQRQYHAYYYMLDPFDHLAELGWHYFQRGEYERTRNYYEQLFNQREENPDYYYHLAAVAWAEDGNAAKILTYLREAADRGWSAYEFTAQQGRFKFVHDTAEWQTILAQIQHNAEANTDS